MDNRLHGPPEIAYTILYVCTHSFPGRESIDLISFSKLDHEPTEQAGCHSLLEEQRTNQRDYLSFTAIFGLMIKYRDLDYLGIKERNECFMNETDLKMRKESEKLE